MRLLIVTSFLLLIAASPQAVQNNGWTRLAPAGGGFSVMMPAPAKEEETKQTVQDFIAHFFATVTDKGVYIAGYGDYAASVHLDPAAELIANRDNFLKGLNARVIDNKKIERNGHSGLEFTGESDQYYFKSRLYILGNRVYQIAVAFPKDVDDSVNVSRFFESFTLEGGGSHPQP